MNHFNLLSSLYKNSKNLCNEESFINPTSLYTETKLISENIIKSSNKRYVMLTYQESFQLIEGQSGELKKTSIGTFYLIQEVPLFDFKDKE